MSESRSWGERAAAWLIPALAAGALFLVPEVPLQATRPQGGRELCLTCHEDLAAEFQGKVVHAPVAADECVACHDPHAARHSALLRKTSPDLCTDCHDDVEEEVSRPVLHLALREDRSCLGCHAPHSSAQAALLKSPAPGLCTPCHPGIKAKLETAHPHPPAAEGNCTSCHLPHGGTVSALLQEPAKALCRSCHETGGAAMRAAHHNFELKDADCTLCHNPHGSAATGMIRPVVHPPFEDDCANCHLSAARPAERTAPVPALCTDCHGQEPRYVAGPPRGHPVGEEVTCTDCHSAHAGEPPAMMRGSQRPLCLSCHVEIRRAINTGVSFHPPKVEQGRCSACHKLHDPAGEKLLAAEGGAVCVRCHENHARFAHPMGSNVPDPSRPGKTVDCLSCHLPHASDQKMLLRASPRRELCIRCHTKLHG